ncbi:uncharacterized protein LOC142560001 isoform X1 [Dermacentor variabilis]|uniref:uncharacterized protein LOC142559932 isoform X2 n=1 Tax=Dermacentor variabilis TaxID=34621 RepID=UPI003F5C8204
MAESVSAFVPSSVSDDVQNRRSTFHVFIYFNALLTYTCDVFSFFVRAEHDQHEIDVVVPCLRQSGKDDAGLWCVVGGSATRVARLYELLRKEISGAFGSSNAGTKCRAKFLFLEDEGQQLSKEPRPGDVHGHIAMKIRVGKRPLPAPQHISRLAGWTRTPPLVACCPASQGRLRCVSSRAAWLTGSGDDGEHIHTTNFGESLDLEQPDARATEQSLTQSGEVQLERQDSNLRHSSHIHCHDDVAIRTVAENYDKRVAPHTKIKFENTADQKPRRGRLRR